MDRHGFKDGFDDYQDEWLHGFKVSMEEFKVSIKDMLSDLKDNVNDLKDDLIDIFDSEENFEDGASIF